MSPIRKTDVFPLCFLPLFGQWGAESPGAGCPPGGCGETDGLGPGYPCSVAPETDQGLAEITGPDRWASPPPSSLKRTLTDVYVEL